MLGANRTITIFNRYIDADRKERWAGTVIKGVSWQYSHAAQTGKEGMQTSETCTIRIPTNADTQGKSLCFPPFLPPKSGWSMDSSAQRQDCARGGGKRA